MKYLIQNFKECLIFIGVIAFVVITLIWSIYSIFTNQFDYKNLIELVGGVLAIFGCYFNMPTSDVNNVITPIMRQAREEADKGDYTLLDMIRHAVEEWESEEDDD